ncbi:MAG TPA: hypothetical protein VM555_02320 [Tahibacter sp.]|jgi:hypothetical protein|nr:hypothetical protein [Tahibacter sp.]
MKTPRLYEFEGAPRSVAEIAALVPALGSNAIRMRLERGMTTRAAMLAFDKTAAIRAAGRRGRAACGNKLTFARKA